MVSPPQRLDPVPVPKPRLLIVEDHALMREGLRIMSESTGRFEEVTETGSLAGALAQLRSGVQPTLIILDLGLPDSDGPNALQALAEHGPEIPILVISGSDDPRAIDESFAMGARGYLPKNSSPRTFRAALEILLAGDLYVPPHVLPSQSQANRPLRRSHSSAPDVRLTRRQSDVLLLLARGMTNKEIAAELDMSLSTVRAHLSAIFRLLGAENRTQAAMSPAAMRLLGATEEHD